MNLNPVDWTKAQDLLLKLVQVLTPMTDREVPISFFLNKRFIHPPELQNSISFRHPVRVLTLLKKQVEELIGEETVFKPSKESPKSKESVGERAKITPTSEQTSPPSAPSKRELAPLSVSKQAKELVRQVQHAIFNLCNSNNIKDPKEAPLREALKFLKPELDRIIRRIAEEGEVEIDEEPSLSTRITIPSSQREQVIKKSILREEIRKSSQANEEKMGAKKAKPPIESQRSEAMFIPEKNLHSNEIKKQKVDPSQILQKEEKKEPSLSKNNPPAKIDRETMLPQLEESAISKQDLKVPRTIERTSLPLVPFMPDSRNLTPARKKKKRKGFWFRDDEDDRNNS